MAEFLQNINDNYSGVLSLLTSIVMIIITIVYVVATIRINKSNKVSADSARAQLEESKKQFAESKEQYEEMRRLSSMPFLQLELNCKKDRNADFMLELPIYKGTHKDLFSRIALIRNIGNGTAMNITYTWECKENVIFETNFPPLNAIRFGDSYLVELYMEKTKDNKAVHGTLTFDYQDLIGNEYDQVMHITFHGYEIEVEIDTPKL